MVKAQIISNLKSVSQVIKILKMALILVLANCALAANADLLFLLDEEGRPRCRIGDFFERESDEARFPKNLRECDQNDLPQEILQAGVGGKAASLALSALNSIINMSPRVSMLFFGGGQHRNGLRCHQRGKIQKAQND